MDFLLQVKDLEKKFILHQFDGKEIVGCSNVNFSIEKGKFLGIVGKSGAGKSTILKSIYRTYIPTSGEIWFNSNEYGFIDLCKASDRQIINLRKKEIGYVSQFLKALPRVTAIELVMYSLIESGFHYDEAKKEAEKVLEHFQIDKNLWDAYPNNFSGGEKLRLNIAKAMVKKPNLLLLDEPTASLDNHSKKFVKDMIIDLKNKGTTMIGIFHDLDFMESVIDEKFEIKKGIMKKSEVA